MADFDPDGNVQENMQPVQNRPAPEPAPYNAQGSNKFTRNTKHPFMIIVYIIFKLWFIAYGVVAMFFKFGALVGTICNGLGIAFDFYVSKNFAGRYLAGLRWHTYVVEGKTWYYFEADDREMSKMEKIIFWSGMWLSPVYYAAMILAYLFTIQWFSIPLCVLGFAASTINLVAYLKCSKDARARMSYIGNDIARSATKAAVNYGAYQMMYGMQ